MELGTFEQIAAVLAVCVIIGTLARLLHQPLVVGLLAAGIAVGPDVLGLVEVTEEIELLTAIGISLLLFVVGLKLDVRLVSRLGPVALATGLGQVAFTSAFGFLIARVTRVRHGPGRLHRGRAHLLVDDHRRQAALGQARTRRPARPDRARVPDRAGSRRRAGDDRRSPRSATDAARSPAEVAGVVVRGLGLLLACGARRTLPGAPRRPPSRPDAGTAHARGRDLGRRPGRGLGPARLLRGGGRLPGRGLVGVDAVPGGAERAPHDTARLPAGLLLHRTRRHVRALAGARPGGRSAACSPCSC